MALISYPECSKEISGRAESCPQCGFPVSRPSEDDGYITLETDSPHLNMIRELLNEQAAGAETAQMAETAARRTERDGASAIASCIKEEKLSNAFAAMFTKALFAAAIIYFTTGRGGASLAANLMGGFMLYWLFSFVHAAFKLTRSYIVGFVLGIAMAMGFVWFLGKMDGRFNIISGSSLAMDIFVYILFGIPLVWDIINIVRIARKK
jgi:hypothetical protein